MHSQVIATVSLSIILAASACGRSGHKHKQQKSDQPTVVASPSSAPVAPATESLAPTTLESVVPSAEPTAPVATTESPAPAPTASPTEVAVVAVTASPAPAPVETRDPEEMFEIVCTPSVAGITFPSVIPHGKVAETCTAGSSKPIATVYCDAGFSLLGHDCI